MTERTENTVEKIIPRPIMVEDAIPYQVDWDAQKDEKFEDGFTVSFRIRYNINPEVMLVISEIARHQMQKVLDDNMARKPKDRMTPGQREGYVKAIRIMEFNINGLARNVYKHQLEKQEDQRKEASGEKVNIEVVSDISTIKKITKSRQDKK